MKAVTGSMSGTQLTWLPSEHLTWVAWKKGHPQGEVLSTETGARRNYSGNPYSGYEQSGQTMFPVPTYRADLPKKDWVVGVLVDDVARAYPLKFLPPGRTVRDKIHSDTLEITFHRDSQRVEVRRAESGEVLPSVKVYWFAWQAFYPNTGLWRPR